MADYDFKSLSPFDFENLIADILQEDLKVRLEAFKSGRDQGIDLRYSMPRNKSCIIQCKHFADSSVSTLISKLRKIELPKIRRISPNRYILVTSQSLSPKNKQMIFDTLKPFIKSTGDIYGKREINGRLRSYPDIERQHYKLWLTSTEVLKTILHSQIYNQTKAELKQIQKKLKLYVQNKSFFTAREILEKSHFCIISGNPGIGKTTLAETLLMSYLKNGYEPVIITSNISEAFALLDPKRKQFFYYDDFLGQTSIEEGLNKNEDKNLIRFFKTIKDIEGKRFVLTTREHILKQARQKYELIDKANLDLQKCIIDLEDYTKLDKAKILLNHLTFSSLPDEYKTQILADNSFLKIIKHPNYSPRIIEWMTEASRNIKTSVGSYLPNFLAILENPSELWAHAFEYQIKNYSRCLLLTLTTIEYGTKLSSFEKVFYSYYKGHSARVGYPIEINAFKKALKESEGNFIKIDKTDDENYVRFQNPSVRDFLENYLVEHPSELEIICSCIQNFEQCVALWKGDIIEKIVKSPKEFLGAVRRTFKENSSVVAVYGSGFSHCSSKLETRLDFMIKPMKLISAQEVMPIVSEISEFMANEVRDGRFEAGKLINLIEELNVSGLIDDEIFQSLIQGAKEKFVGGLCELTDLNQLEHIMRFQECCPALVTDEEFKLYRSLFEDFYRSDVDYYADDVDDLGYLNDYIDKITRVSSRFAVDISPAIKRLKSRKESLEQDAPQEDESFYEPDSKKDGDVDDKEIVAMFDSLLQ
jgi:hypothetical protein